MALAFFSIFFNEAAMRFQEVSATLCPCCAVQLADDLQDLLGDAILIIGAVGGENAASRRKWIAFFRIVSRVFSAYEEPRREFMNVRIS